MSTDIHDKIRYELERRLAIARAATPGPWEMRNSEVWWISQDLTETEVVDAIGEESDPQTEPNARFIVEHDPADAIRRYTHALVILERHAPRRNPDWGTLECEYCASLCHSETGLRCDRPDAPTPCPDLLDLAESLGIDTGGQP